MTDTPDTSPEAPPKDFWTCDDTIKQVLAKLEGKKERHHDLSGVHYEPDQDCRMAMWVIEALSAKLEAAEAERDALKAEVARLQRVLLSIENAPRHAKLADHDLVEFAMELRDHAVILACLQGNLKP
jgi:predicted RNase H-like nuclease (RuvC/YqgF family)